MHPSIPKICFYIFTTFGGLLVDFTLATLAIYILNMPLILAGVVGLVAGILTNYFIYLKITFQHRDIKASWDGLGKYFKTCLFGIGIRIIALTFLSWFTDFLSILSLLIATCLSATFNHVLSRFYVFRQKSD